VSLGVLKNRNLTKWRRAKTATVVENRTGICLGKVLGKKVACLFTAH